MSAGPAPDWQRGPAALAALDEEWDAVAARCRTPFALSAWLRPWYAAFGEDREPQLLRVLEGGEVRGGAALLAARGELAFPVNDHTPDTELPVADGPALEAVAAAVMRAPAACVRLDALDAGGEAAAALTACGRRAGRRLVTEPRALSPVVDTSRGREAVRAATKSRWGAPLDRFRRKMQREHGAELALLEAPDDLEPVLERGFAVESSGWKARAGTGILSSPATATFYREMAAAFHGRGQLRLSWINLDGRMAAFDLTLEHAGRLFLLKTGFDEDFRRLAPGLVLRLAVVETCADRGLEAHELLGGDDPWKRKFAQGERAHVAVHAYRRTPVGTAAFAYRRGVRPTLLGARRRWRARRSA